MESVEISARTVEEAIEAALFQKELGLVKPVLVLPVVWGRVDRNGDRGDSVFSLAAVIQLIAIPSVLVLEHAVLPEQVVFREERHLFVGQHVLVLRPARCAVPQGFLRGTRKRH